MARALHRRLRTKLFLATLTLALPGLAQEPMLGAATGGVAGHRLVVLPAKGSGLYSWALPVTLAGLLQQAQVDTLPIDKLAALLKQKGLPLLSSGLPAEWDKSSLNAAAGAAQAGKDAGFVLQASWNTTAPQGQWVDTTTFWLEARLSKGDAVVFDNTRLPRAADKFYRLADYDAALRDLADMVLASINPDLAGRARSSEVWAQRITLPQVRLLAEAEQSIAAGNLDDARVKLGQAQAAAPGQEGSLLALRRLLEVNEALRARDPSRAGDLGREAEQQGLALAAQGAKAEAWGLLLTAEGRRLQGKWQEAEAPYFSWLQYLADEKMIRPEEVFPIALREELNARRPDPAARLKSPRDEADWWGTLALAFYRGVSGEMADVFLNHAAEVAGAKADPMVTYPALTSLASRAAAFDPLWAMVTEQAVVFAYEKGAPGSILLGLNYALLGQMYDARWQPDNALAEYQKALAIYDKVAPESVQRAQVEALLADVYASRDDYDNALAGYLRAVALAEKVAPDTSFTSRLYGYLGGVYLRREDLPSALVWYRKAQALSERLAPDSLDLATAFDNLALAFESAHDYAQALDWYGKALALRQRLAPDSTDVAYSYLALAGASRRKGDLDRALDYARQAVTLYDKLAPGTVLCGMAYNAVGAAYEAKGDLASALDWYGRIVALQERIAPGSLLCATTYGTIAVVHASKGDYDEAIAWYTKALVIADKLAPDSEDAELPRLGIALAYRQHGDNDRAIDWYGKALDVSERRKPGSLNSADICLQLGHTCEEKGDLDHALEWLSKALAMRQHLSPDSLLVASSYDDLGQLRIMRREMPLAVDAFTKAVALRERLAPNTLDLAVGYERLGLINRQLDNLDAAEAFVRKALPLREKLDAGSDDHAEDVSEIGFLLLLRGKPDDALPHLQRAVAIKPGYAFAQLRLAFGLIALNRFADAQAPIDNLTTRPADTLGSLIGPGAERVAKQLLDGGKPGGYYLIARVLQAAGQKAKAGAAYDTFLKSAKPDHPWRADATARRAQ